VRASPAPALLRAARACWPPSLCHFRHRLEDAGVGIGRRTLELACWRDRSSKRETRVRGILQFVTQTLWKSLFGAVADSLQRSVDSEDEYMIIEKVRVARPAVTPTVAAPLRSPHRDPRQEPLVNSFISSAPVNCAAFVAGIVRGVLEAAQFPAQVT